METFQHYWEVLVNYFSQFAQLIKITDIIDIAILAFLIYQLIKFVRKTNATAVMKGIVILVVALFLSGIFQLNVMNYLLNRAFEMGLFILVILFQPEIRRMLEQVGNSKLSDFFGRQVGQRNIETAITQTVLACTDMSISRTGALIVFERGINLDNYIKTGTIVDAAPAAELIKNMFFNKAPLHDGAVIIRDGRIAGAACMLPLSGNNNISRALGMRHRAGIGMSERSDAVVVIVSEETGDISVALEGIIKRGLTPESLEKVLRNELMPAEDEEKTVWQKISDFFAPKAGEK
ncbi:MAG: diadenylate cyclase CdaA [Oscillospiraceae bacterium]|nr:diadenylate cyclase CdaA [Oscillospiraceae bacterium]